ncbi:MAG: hypothetical protein JSS30_08135 [Verrucomicrobia bacterium]|nr:hypothetical protein [Verrucomicrobiota bacterium]
MSHAVTLNRQTETFEAIQVDPKILENAERLQQKIDPIFPSDSFEANENHLRSLPPQIQQKAEAIMDEICKVVGHEPLSRRMMKRNQRIAEVVESHIFTKKNREWDKKNKIDGNVDDQKGIKYNQAYTQIGGGVSSLCFALLGVALPAPYGEAFKQLSNLNLPQYAVSAISTSYDGQQTPLSNEQSFFLNTIQTEKQSAESLKNLIEQLRNLDLELMRTENRSIESIFAR